MIQLPNKLGSLSIDQKSTITILALNLGPRHTQYFCTQYYNGKIKLKTFFSSKY